ncbi:hypothetical protein JOM56_005323 [Amanita muscaria]
MRYEIPVTYWQTLSKRRFNFSALHLRSLVRRLRSSMSVLRKRERLRASARMRICVYFDFEKSPAFNPCAVLSVIFSTKSPHTVAIGGAASPYFPRSQSAPGNSAVISASGSYASSANVKSLRSSSSRIDVCRLRIRLSILAPHRRIRKGKRSTAFETARAPMREMNSFAAAMSSGVGGPFFARTSCIFSRLSNAAAITSPGLPVVRARAIVSRRRTSRLVFESPRRDCLLL